MLDADGTVTGYKLNGRKQWISNGGIADAYTILALAPGGPTWFVLERGAAGFTQAKPEDKHGIRLSNTAAQPRLNTLLLSVFASVALLIASIGIYGVLAYSVSQRTGEIGVRMALGATPRGVLRLIVGEGMKVVLIGIGAGLAGGLVVGRAVSSLVFGVPVRDPVTFTAVAVVLAAVAIAACVIPALRASRVDPIVALRNE